MKLPRADRLYALFLRLTRRLSNRKMMMLLAVVGGVLAGLGTYFFEVLLYAIKNGLTRWFPVDSAHFLYLIYPVVGIILASLIVNNIEMLLNYCTRFYDRQFLTRSQIANKDILARFERILNDYFRSDMPQTLGLPTVRYCAGELCLSPNYFGDLVKRETGRTAQEHIRLKLIDTSKELLFDRQHTVSDVAYRLGFKYPAHFTRLFKQVVGCSPNEYRTVN